MKTKTRTAKPRTIRKEYKLELHENGDDWMHRFRKMGLRAFMCQDDGLDNYYTLPEDCVTIWMIVTNQRTPTAIKCQVHGGPMVLYVDDEFRVVWRPLVTAMRRLFRTGEFWMWFEYEVTDA